MVVFNQQNGKVRRISTGPYATGRRHHPKDMYLVLPEAQYSDLFGAIRLIELQFREPSQFPSSQGTGGSRTRTRNMPVCMGI